MQGDQAGTEGAGGDALRESYSYYVQLSGSFSDFVIIYVVIKNLMGNVFIHRNMIWCFQI